MQTSHTMDGNSQTGETHVIRTPDQRVRVFVSSTLDELAPERAAAREAIAQLHLTPVLFEAGARPYPPRELYQAYLAQSDIFLGLYWQRYCWVAPGMEVSGVEDEYQLSAGKPRLIYVKTPAPEREPGLRLLLDRIRADGNASYQHFTTREELRERIANDLALLLTERFAQALKQADSDHPAPLPVPRGHLIDREREVVLVTLTGPGGVGKTRVAVQVATQLATQFADSAAFVSLAQLHDPEPVVQTVARALQVSEAPGQSIGERLLAYLRERHMLLVLDNGEQLVSAAPLATQALEGAPRLKLLITSREPLRLLTEHVVPIQPFALPDPRHLPDLDALAQVPSVALFLERVRAVNPDFALTADNAAAIVEICRRLDGLALALELAAARLSLLGPQALLARMTQRLPVLTRGARDLPQRQQTLRNTIAWSYDLLDEREQHLFRCLSVFVGNFPLEAVESVWADEDSSTSSSSEQGDNDVVELVAQLRDKSLIQPSGTVDEEPSFRMLDTIREYALEQLVASGEEAAVRRRHADFYLRLAETAEPHLRRPERDVWLERLERAHDNLRAVFAWSSENGEARTGLRLAGALAWYWYMRGYLREGHTFLEELLAHSEQADGSAVRGKALSGASLLAWAQGDSGVAGERAERSVALFRALGDVYWLANALAMLGIIQLSQGKLEAARASFEESRSLFQEQGLTLFEAFVVYQLGRAAFAGQDVMQAKTRFQQSLALFQEEGDKLGEAMALTALGIVAAAQGDAAAARSLLTQSVPLMRAAGDRRDLTQSLLTAGTVRLKQGDLQQAHNLFTESMRLWEGFADHEQAAVIRRALTGLAEVAAAQGRAERAGVLFGAAETLSPLPANFLSEVSSIDMDQDIAQARAHLDQAAFEAGWAAGQAMMQEQALSYALQDG